MINKSLIPITSLKLSDRMQKLKDELLDSPHVVSTECARLTKEIYDNFQGEPITLTRARVVKNLFEKMTVYIRDGELLVGNRSEKLGATPVLEDFDTGSLAEIHETRYEFRRISEEFLKGLSEEARNAQDELWAGYPAGRGSGYGHILADYELIIKQGAYALAEKARAYAVQFEKEGKIRQKQFCEASAMVCQAFGDWGKRYAALAKEQSAECPDNVRKAELEKIAEVCERVPAYPARNFYEALQSLWFAHQGVFIEQFAGSISIGNMDTILIDYYRNDLASGEITRGFAEEIMENFFIKNMENSIRPRETVLFENLAIGGQDMDGNDLTNDISWIILDTTAKVRSAHPLPSVRWHPNIDKDFWRRAIECIGIGLGLPALFSDTQMINSMLSWGIKKEEAVTYGVVGCVEPAIKGKLHGQTLGAHVNLLKCMELALNDGKSLITGRQLGPHTGYLKEFTCIEDVWNAYKVQVKKACEINMESVYHVAKVQQENYGYPFMSSLMEGAIENGRDLTYGVKYNHPTVCITGAANVVDTFLVLDNFVFKNSIYTSNDMFNAIVSNFKGYENILRDIRKDNDKFGNGSKKYSDLYNKVCEIHDNIFITQHGPRGGHFASGLWPTTWHISQGRHTGASIDGRLASEPLVDSVGPVSSRAVSGPTAILRDVAGIDAVRHWPGGYTLNLKFSDDMFKTSNSLDKLAALIDTFFRIGGMQVQINTISSDILKAAKRDPEKYKDLVVRVAGFSAYFIGLDEGVQDEIISRTELNF